MTFADAVFDRSAELAGVSTRLVDGTESLVRDARCRAFVPMTTGSAAACLAAAAWDVLVDARMRKRAAPEPQRALARLVVGLGPGFVAGGNVDLAVETAWGERLGAVVEAGPTLPLAGEPRTIDGVGRERPAYAPVTSVWRTDLNIGEPVNAGQVVGQIGEVAESISATQG
jgi:xanthine dehydrogenase accessory factor